MSNQPGAMSPYLQGDVITPDRVLDPQSVPAHNFFNTMRDLINKVVYHNESDLHAALDSVDAFEKRYIGGDHAHVVQEGEAAGREDVTQRKGHNSVPVMPSNVPQIDYGMLARAMIQAQRDAEAEANTPAIHATITDVPEED